MTTRLVQPSELRVGDIILSGVAIKTRREVISIEHQPRGMIVIKTLDRFGYVATDRLRAKRNLLFEIEVEE